MKEKVVRFGDFVVPPEYCELTDRELNQASLDGSYQVASFPLVCTGDLTIGEGE